MTGDRREGGRAGGAVPPLLLIVGGLLLTVVAVVALVLQLRSDEPSAAGTAQPTTVTSAPPATEAPDTSEDTSTATTGRPTPSPTPSPEPSPSPSTSPAAAPSSDAAPAPTWLTIASGGIDSALVPQGLAADGTINPGRQEVIWFTGGDRVAPGQVGTSVIAGHVTWEGAPDAFVDLPSVGIGDVVTVGYDDGSSRSFTVTSASAVDKDQLARSLTVWGPHPDRPRLAIITCDPVLGYQADGHTQANYVVIAEG